MDKKRNAAALLREHDKLRARARALERETQKAVTEYGLSVGVWGLSMDKFRLQLQMEEERKQKQKKERASG
jgi:hypothetical protein